MFKSLLFFITLTYSQLAFSYQEITDDSKLNSIRLKATKLKLYDDPTWLRLLHFRVSPKVSSHSDILTPSFFNAIKQKAPQNKTLKRQNISAKQELFASLTAFYQPLKKDHNLHPRCRFPARYYWLDKQLKLSQIPFPTVTCNRMNSWAKFKTLDSVSLILVSGYFGNPASTFGHLLVKLNNSEFKNNSGNLLDQSINYGAKVPENEKLPIYIMKGLTGGYVSRFSDNKFYTQDLVYSRQEYRDMWEYELNLTHDQNRLLVYHIWEMLGMESTYYFLKENCGYRIAELLELVTGKTITPDTQPWYLPISVFQDLEDIEKSRYIKKITFLPSNQRKLYEGFNNLNNKEADAVNNFLANPKRLQTSLFNKFSPDEKSEMIKVMLDYYQYKISDTKKNQRTINTLKNHKNRLIIERLKLPVLKRNRSQSISHIKSPAQGAKPRLFHVGLAHSKARGNEYELGLTAIHYDMLSNSEGSLKNSELKVFDLAVKFNDKEQLSLSRFDIIKIQKLGLNNTKLFGETNPSWRISTGFEESDLSCVDCMGFYIRGGIGHTLKLAKNTIAYGMIDTSFSNENNEVNATPNIGLILSHSKKLKTVFEAGTSINIKNGENDERAKLEMRYLLSKNNAIRLSFDKFRGDSTKISFFHNW